MYNQINPTSLLVYIDSQAVTVEDDALVEGLEGASTAGGVVDPPSSGRAGSDAGDWASRAAAVRVSSVGDSSVYDDDVSEASLTRESLLLEADTLFL